MRSGGIEEATEDGPRIELRDRLEALLKGGCGRSFATQSAALKHMKHCCPNIIEPYAFEEPNPVKAASKDLAFHGDRGLGGVYVEEVNRIMSKSTTHSLYVDHKRWKGCDTCLKFMMMSFSIFV
jgi:hypothetical protein